MFDTAKAAANVSGMLHEALVALDEKENLITALSLRNEELRKENEDYRRRYADSRNAPSVCYPGPYIHPVDAPGVPNVSVEA